MSNIVKVPFAVAATLAGALGLGGCTDSPYDARKLPVIKGQTGFSAELIQKGDFFGSLENGAYQLTVPAERLGGKPGEEIQCLMIKDRESGSSRTYGGLSCDWQNPRPAAPAPK